MINTMVYWAKKTLNYCFKPFYILNKIEVDHVIIILIELQYSLLVYVAV